MFEEISLNSKYYYHDIISCFMLLVWVYIAYKGYKSKNDKLTYKISSLIIIICLIQESIDYINRIFLDSNYLFSVQRDLPFLHFCKLVFIFQFFVYF